MAEPTEGYPAEATNAAAKARTNGEGQAALEETIDRHGEDLAEVLDEIEHLDDLLTTAIIVLASVDEQEVEHVTDSASNLVTAADGLSTEEVADLAADLGEDADDLAAALDVVLELQREGNLEGLVNLAKAFSELEVDPDAVDGLNALLGAVGDAQRETEPESLLDTLKKLRSADALAGVNYLLTLLRGLGGRLRDR